MRGPPTISRAGSSHSMTGGLPITSQCRVSIREHPQVRRKRSAVTIPVRAAQERNTRNAADSTKRRHCGAHRMVTLHRYLSEFDFRYSNRVALGVNDGER